MKPLAELSYKELLADGYAVAGSPERVTARLRELHDELGFGQLIHPQTVRYRMHQLMELFGDRLNNPDFRFEIEAALRARTLLD